MENDLLPGLEYAEREESSTPLTPGCASVPGLKTKTSFLSQSALKIADWLLSYHMKTAEHGILLGTQRRRGLSLIHYIGLKRTFLILRSIRNEKCLFPHTPGFVSGLVIQRVPSSVSEDINGVKSCMHSDMPVDQGLRNRTGRNIPQSLVSK